MVSVAGQMTLCPPNEVSSMVSQSAMLNERNIVSDFCQMWFKSLCSTKSAFMTSQGVSDWVCMGEIKFARLLLLKMN